MSYFAPAEDERVCWESAEVLSYIIGGLKRAVAVSEGDEHAEMGVMF
jgi:hypothetical protein